MAASTDCHIGSALVDSDTLHVDGYFEETKLPRIQLGDRVAIHLMGNAARLTGHVESITAGIEDRDRGEGATLVCRKPKAGRNDDEVRRGLRVS